MSYHEVDDDHISKKQKVVFDDQDQDKELLMLNFPNQFSPDVISNKCFAVYEGEKAKRKQTLINLDGKISLSADILRARKSNSFGSQYMCLTACFIDENWEMKRWILKVYQIECSVDDSILAVLIEWGIESKINTITMVQHVFFTDETVENIKGYFNYRKVKLPLDGKLFRVHCCCDVVKLMVKDLYNGISESVDQISELYPMKERTRTWTSKNNQLKEALKLHYAGHYSSSEEYYFFYMPSEIKLKEVSNVCDLVDDVYKVVFPLFEKGYLTSNIFLHHLQELQSHLLKKEKSVTGIIKNVTEKMVERFDKYMKEMYLVIALSSVMDPRFKMKYIEFSSSIFKGDTSNSWGVKSVLEAIQSLYEEYTIHDDPTKDGCLGHELLIEYKKFLKSNDQAPKSELVCYLEEPIMDWSKDFNILSWWKGESSRYPTLSRMARDLLAIPVTIGISDDAFYMEQREIDDSVSAFEPKLINTFMCLRSWFAPA